MKNQTKKGLNAGNLKMIALFCMVIDHIGVAILLPLTKDHNSVMWIYYMFRFVGRIAFPLFAFFVTEGYFHTKNKWKYAIRLLSLAFISEVPFDMVLGHEFYYPEFQNVFFTLLAGLLTIWIIDLIGKAKLKTGASFILKILIISIVCYLMEFAIRGDYGAIGLFVIVSIYLTRQNEKALTILSFAFASAMAIISYYDGLNEDFFIYVAISAVCLFAMIYIVYMRQNYTKEMTISVLALTALNTSEVFAFADVYLISKYNGEKGKINKWFFYFAYPVHLLLLALLCMALKLY